MLQHVIWHVSYLRLCVRGPSTAGIDRRRRKPVGLSWIPFLALGMRTLESSHFSFQGAHMCTLRHQECGSGYECSAECCFIPFAKCFGS